VRFCLYQPPPCYTTHKEEPSISVLPFILHQPTSPLPPFLPSPPATLRLMHVSNMLLEVKNHIAQAFPFWNRTQVRSGGLFDF
jgi:hypothetical protein